MSENNFDIIKDIQSISGIYERVFGWLLSPLVLYSRIRNTKHLLEKVYGFTDTDIFTDKVDDKQFKDISKIIFRFYGESNKNNFIDNIKK